MKSLMNLFTVYIWIVDLTIGIIAYCAEIVYRSNTLLFLVYLLDFPVGSSIVLLVNPCKKKSFPKIL